MGYGERGVGEGLGIPWFQEVVLVGLEGVVKVMGDFGDGQEGEEGE